MEYISIFTFAGDPRGSRSWRHVAKIWSASLARHVFAGKVLVIRSLAEPLFPTGRTGLIEMEATSEELDRIRNAGSVRGARDVVLQRMVQDQAEEEWLVGADADCVALRNPDHLFERQEALLVNKSGGVVDGGFWAIRRDIVSEFAELVAEVGFDRAVGSGRWRVGEFERGEVVRVEKDTQIVDLFGAAVVHLGGLPEEEKWRAAFALHMMAVYGTEDGMFLDLLES